MNARPADLDMLQAALARPDLSPGARGFLFDIRRKAALWPLTARQREAVGRIAHAPPPPDFPAVAHAALPHLPELCRRWLPGGKQIGREWTCGSLAGEPGASCRVNLRTGRWADFAAGQKGGDAVSLAAAVHRLTQVEAAARLAAMLGMGSANDGR